MLEFIVVEDINGFRVALQPAHISAYFPAQGKDESGNEIDGTIIFFGGGSVTIEMPVDEFEEALISAPSHHPTREIH